jgi:C-terminal processing protease CtpA/Prc
LPNGWTYKITVALVLSRNDEVFEGKGIPPDFTVRISQPDYLNRKDPIIEKAISLMDK